MACRKPPSRASYCGKARQKRRKRRSRSKKRKSCRPGKVTRNPFFNFLRWYRKKNCGKTMIQVAIEGAKCWCQMSDQQRKKFYAEACRAPKMRRRRSMSCGRSRRRKRKSRSRSRRSRSRRSRSRSSCYGGKKKRRRSKRKKSRSGAACFQPRRAKCGC